MSGRAATWAALLMCGVAYGDHAVLAGPAFRDPYPLPADKLHVRMAEVSTHGGRFVVAQTRLPKTFKVPIRNRFGNFEPTVIPHHILWNIDRVYIKPSGQSRAIRTR